MFLVYYKKVLFYVLVLTAPSFIIYFVYFYGATCPISDQWELVPLLRKMHDGELAFTDIWIQHREHRMLFPKLIMLALAWLTDWNIMYELYTNIVLAGLILLFLYFLLWQSVSNSISSWLMVMLSFIFFSPVQWENWLWGWPIQIFLSVLATVVAVWSVSRWPGQLRGVLVAIGCAVISSYSYTSGLLTWIVVIMLMAQRGRKWKHILLWITAFIAATTYYYYGYTKIAHHSSLLYSLNHPYDYTRYILAYLGSPLSFGTSAINRKDISTAIGLLLVIIACALTIHIRRSSKEEYIKLLPWQALGSYAVLNAAATGVGRLRFGVFQALSSRYTIFSILFIISVIIILVVWVKQNTRIHNHLPKKSVIFVSCISTLFFVSYILSFSRSIRESTVLSNNIQRDVLSLEYIETAPDKSLGIFYPDVAIVRSYTKILLDLGLTFNAIQWDKLRKVEGGQFSIDGINGLDVHKQVQPILIDISKNSTLILDGWAVDKKAGGIADSVYITLDDKPIAHAYYGVKRSDVARHFKVNRYKYSGWETSINLNEIAMGEHKISLRIVSKDKKSYSEPESGVLIKVKK